jgi:acyl dehydratase
MRETAELLHHEDLEIGKAIAFGHKTVTKDEIIAFAQQFDPQPMHLDEEAAKETLTKGLCASGFHTCAMMMRLVVDGLLGKVASLGSPGVDEVRWLKPVRPGDILHARYTCTEKRALASRPDVGLSKILVEMMKETGEPVATWRSNQLTRMRHAAAVQPSHGKAARKPMPTLWDDGIVADAPVADVFFEDRRIGEVVDIGAHTFDKGEIIDFARRFDPQPFHLDEEAAKASLFGALCASGWHTASSFIRCVVTSRMALNAAARARGERVAIYGPSPGFRNLLWFHPVFVGDTISFRGRLTEKVDLKSRPERGLLINEVQGRNQNGAVVFAITSQILAERREPYRAT